MLYFTLQMDEKYAFIWAQTGLDLVFSVFSFGLWLLLASCLIYEW